MFTVGDDVTEVPGTVMMILRTYALYNRSKRLLWTLVVIGAILTGVTVWNTQGQDTSTLTALPGCHPHIAPVTAFHFAAAWGALFVFDIIIFVLTVYNGWLAARRLGPTGPMSLHMLIIRDGALYFAVMVLANLVNILTFIIDLPVLPGSLAPFASSISITMMARLMLNLHEHADRGILTANDTTTMNAEVIFLHPQRRGGYPLM
ncbi:hypothetical protein C8R44DRAFT_891688 [Mycena epipterygia]|nr:hypothetical protein C8R44DRAFT_891688 [Mycena epipterygia]